jgi:putative membrane protein
VKVWGGRPDALSSFNFKSHEVKYKYENFILIYSWAEEGGRGGMTDFFGSWLLSLIFWILIIIGIIAVMRWIFNRGRRGPRDGRGIDQDRETSLDSRERSMDVLRERYARGELSKEEYEARKRELM